MKEKIKNALRQVQLTDNKIKSVSLTHKSKLGDKKAVARIHLDDKRQPKISLSSNAGFSQKYIKEKFKSEFESVINSVLPPPGPGAVILILDMPPLSGGVTLLPSSTYYYSIGGGPILCGGAQLRSDFQAVYIRKFTAICMGGSLISEYKEFKLQ